MLFVNRRADHDQVETAWISFGDVLYYHVDVSDARSPFSYPPRYGFRRAVSRVVNDQNASHAARYSVRHEFQQSRVELLEEPRHVLAKGGHRGHALSIVFCFTDSMADTDIPVARTGNDHLTNEEEVIDRVESVNGASASHRYHCSADFTLKHVAVGARYHPSAVNKRFEFGR